MLKGELKYHLFSVGVINLCQMAVCLVIYICKWCMINKGNISLDAALCQLSKCLTISLNVWRSVGKRQSQCLAKLKVFRWHCSTFNSLGPRQNGHHFADDIFNCISLNKNVWIPIKISLTFVPKGPINNISALVQIMAWRRLGDKPFSEPVMVSLLMHICVTRPQWVNIKRNLCCIGAISCWIHWWLWKPRAKHWDWNPPALGNHLR